MGPNCALTAAYADAASTAGREEEEEANTP